MRSTFFGSALLLLRASGALAQATPTPSTEAQVAALDDPTDECTYRYWPPLTAANTSNNWPWIWVPATTIPPGDTAAQNLFNSMKSGIPNIAPQGTLGGSLNIDSYDRVGDPDCWWSASQCTKPKVSGIPEDIATVPEPRTLGYGFDDGPNCSHNAFYTYLTEQQQKATMFFIGSNVLDWPLQAQRAVADGHEICAHTWSHRNMTMFEDEGVFAEIYYSVQAIKLTTGYTTKCWRPPFGDIDDRVRYIANQLGLQTVLWKYDSFDYTAQPPAQIQANYDNLINNATSGTFDTVGAIILTHELNNFTMQLAVDNYPKLAAAFDHIVPIAVALNQTNPYIETNFTMQTFAEYTAARANSSSGPSGSGSASKAGVTGAAKGDSAGVALRPATLASAALTLAGAALALFL
ncbi:carbohydrate esterase family 4 protein [Roridomyces roridus]|uniref:chitin deacetylase n=1 Tax=Roridomyces roridus TaxID=1738132 RepID=A0AAD7FP50_9AGAR|nr:carbohydrate esterase family 4 protein [Roridomyces roridus]